MYQDKTLTCRDCGCEFVFSASEQAFYAEKGFQNEPGRCPECRAARKATRGSGEGRQMFDVTCAECGKPLPITPEQAKFLAARQQMDPSYFSRCEDCQRKATATTLGKIAAWNRRGQIQPGGAR
jgi:hypothetical protein